MKTSFGLIFMASLALASAQTLDICNTAAIAGGLAKDPTFSQIYNQLCPSPSSQNSQCGSSESRLANSVLCSMGADSCHIDMSSTGSNLYQFYSQYFSNAISQVPQLQTAFKNPVFCAVVEQSCCLSRNSNEIALANDLASLIQGKPFNLMNEIQNAIGTIDIGKLFGRK